jgi:sulfur relay (sulfurtransferase) complex TusBCD TusD component (DsrE family)
MLKVILNRDGEVKACVVCLSSRGIEKDQFLEGVKSSNMAELADWVKSSDKIICF